MKLKDRQQIIHKYGSVIHTDAKIDEVIELFYKGGDNSSRAIAEKVGLKPYQVNQILTRYDETAKAYYRK
jgi:transcription initiation factor IIE alpha subunit